jgi:hypothetical protein
MVARSPLSGACPAAEGHARARTPGIPRTETDRLARAASEVLGVKAGGGMGKPRRLSDGAALRRWRIRALDRRQKLSHGLGKHPF